MFHHAYRFLALGDSYTIGENVDPSDRWPAQLVSMLGKNGLDIAELRYIARTGWTTGELLQTLERERIEGTYDLVSILIGVNNQYRGLDKEEFRREFRLLLARAVAFARNDPYHVLVLPIPDWSVTPFAKGRDTIKIRREIRDFNAINQEAAVSAGAVYIDIGSASFKPETFPSLFASDGLHPSRIMYAEWARLALPYAQKALTKQ